MEMDKVLNLDHEEIAQHLRQTSEQVFRLRFQLKMGQMEGLKKLRELRKDIARMKTAERQRELGIALPAHAASAESRPEHHARKVAKSKSVKSVRTGKAAGKTTKGKTSKKSTRTGGKVKATGQTRTKTAKRGRANAKKGS